MLLDQGADPDGYNGNNCPHLVTTAEYGCKRNLQLMIQHGANLKLRTKDGSTALHRAAGHGWTDCVQVGGLVWVGGGGGRVDLE